MKMKVIERERKGIDIVEDCEGVFFSMILFVLRIFVWKKGHILVLS